VKKRELTQYLAVLPLANALKLTQVGLLIDDFVKSAVRDRIHQISTVCMRRIIAAVNTPIGVTILQSISESHLHVSDE